MYEGDVQTIDKPDVIVKDSFLDAIAEIQDHVNTVNSESRQDKVERARDSIRELFDKLTANSRLVGDGLAVLEDHLAYCECLLKRRETTPPAVVVEEVSGDDCDDEETEERVNSCPPPMFPVDGPIEIIIGNPATGERFVINAIQ